MIRFEQRNAAPATSQSHFSQVPRAEIERSKFDRSHTRKMTLNADYLYPIYYDEVLPGDTFNLSLTSLARTQPAVRPFMDNLYSDVFFIYVPNRLLSSKWESIMGQQPDPDTDVSAYALTPLQFTNKAIAKGSLHDYLGFNIKASAFTKAVSPLYHLAYNLSWNELFRDENLQDPVYFDASEATSYDPDNFVLLKRGKRHDYFTSCLPWPQKGQDVLLPLGVSAPITGAADVWVSQSSAPGSIVLANSPVLGYNSAKYANMGMQSTGVGTAFSTVNAAGNAGGVAAASQFEQAVFVDKALSQAFHSGATAPFRVDTTANNTLVADLSDATAASINDIREAFQVQRLLERDARGGTRYIESLLSHFGVTAPDFRLQRPEVLGVGTAKISVSPLPQTSQTSGANVLGLLGGVGSFSHHGVGFTKSFVEHGVILGLMAIRADLTYQQGLHRSYNRFSRLDFAYPVLAHLGEQAVLNQEIYMQTDTVTDPDGIVDYQPFGYQERYAEYRYRPSEICGEFRSDYAQSLDVWHLAQDFSALPGLDDTFIVSDTPMSRVLAVTTQDQFQLDMSVKLICARPLPVYGVPGFIDHF